MHRKVLTEDKCDFCGDSESSGHILWGCMIAKETWNETKFKIDNLIQPLNNFLDMVWLLMETPKEKNWKVFAIMAWSLWNNKNLAHHGGVCKWWKTIAWEAKKYVDEMRASIPIHNKGILLGPMIKHWDPPPQGKDKVNIDVAVFKEQGCCGIGVVIRNDKRQRMGAMCKKVDFPLEDLEVEAKVAEDRY